jgi:archaellum component FlaC
MADDEPLQKIFGLLDALSVQVGTTQAEMHAGFARLEAKVDAGFDRVERRLGNLETRVEGIETEFRAFREETERRVTLLES